MRKENENLPALSESKKQRSGQSWMSATSGRVVGLLTTLFDVLGWRKRQQRLERNWENLNLALEAGRLSVWTYDVKKRMFSTLQDNTFGKRMTMEENQHLIHPDDVQLQMEVLHSIILKEVTHADAIFRYKAIDIKGGYRYYECKMSGKKENGKVVLITGIQKDITDSYIRQLEL